MVYVVRMSAWYLKLYLRSSLHRRIAIVVLLLELELFRDVIWLWDTMVLLMMMIMVSVKMMMRRNRRLMVIMIMTMMTMERPSWGWESLVSTMPLLPLAPSQKRSADTHGSTMDGHTCVNTMQYSKARCRHTWLHNGWTHINTMQYLMFCTI